MIDRKDYSDNVIKVQFNLGGLEIESIQNQVIQIVQKTYELVDYELKCINNQVVLLLTLPIQVIPDIISALAQKDMGIYEVSKFNE
ncbi:hypothetical protein [Lysinibacillus capsici]|uniref:hypothetical protein n=1 Tax=Lysinibacillus capsici TaxID=2115968 RepID=UPI0028A9EF2A|nr:hypothetical protein [Lysinibacillus capsici]